MQSGNLAVMGFWDRERMDRIWRDAVKAAGLEDGDGDGVDCIEAMRALPADELLRLPPLDVSSPTHIRLGFPTHLPSLPHFLNYDVYALSTEH
jgi:hypothetical protein